MQFVRGNFKAWLAVACGMAAVAALACGSPTKEPPVGESAPPPKQYLMGLLQEPKTRNFWSYYAGTAGSVWTGYVLAGVSTSLYDYSEKRSDYIPIVADGMPSSLVSETVGGKEFWTSQVRLKQGLKWSDGKEITAHDFVFVVDTILDMELGGNAAASVDPTYVDHVEAVDDYTIKVYFKARDEEGNPLTPGLSVWQYGLAFTPILAKHYWEPVVEAAKQAGEIEAQQAALFGHVPVNEPTAGGFTVGRWEPGAFIQTNADPNWFRKGIEVIEYQNGAYRERREGTDYDVTYYGTPEGAVGLQLTMGPHYDNGLFNIYSSVDSAVLALENGDVDYIFTPQGLGKGLLDRVNLASDLEVVTNAANSVRYVGFNVRKAPMSIPEFRKAIAVLIDREFVTDSVLRGAAVPAYSMVTEGNVFWHNPDVSRPGQGLERGERIAEAVRLLKQAGFTFDQEPVVGEDGVTLNQRGKGLRMPDGTPVPEIELMAPSEGYDPMRATFAIWISQWLNEAGIPVEHRLMSFNALAEYLFSEEAADELDMWIMGWSLTDFPDYLWLYFHTYNIDNGFNFGGYSNPEFDVLAEGLLSETTLEGARSKVMDMQRFLAEDLPYITLFSPTMTDVYRPSKVKFPYTETLGGIAARNGLQTVVHID